MHKIKKNLITPKHSKQKSKRENKDCAVLKASDCKRQKDVHWENMLLNQR